MTSKSNPAYNYLAREVVQWRSDIFKFIYDMWGLKPQPVKPEYEKEWKAVKRATHENWEEAKKRVEPHWFGNWDEDAEQWSWYTPEGHITGVDAFKEKKYISWQQTLILLGIRKGRNGEASLRLTVRSGHGIGKSAVIAWTMIWFLYCFFQCKAGFTAPTGNQMHDVLWAEASLWINRIKEPKVKKLFVHQSHHIRMLPDPESWYARARTGTKENPEALAGIHADNVMLGADEASGVHEKIFTTIEGALTSGEAFVFLISNPTRTQGYFYDSHKKTALNWQRFHFSSKNSPMVKASFWKDLRARHGEDGREFLIRALGEFPDEGAMDDAGYIPVFTRNMLDMMPDDFKGNAWPHRTILALDPSGKGRDKASWVLRDQFKAKVIKERVTNNPKQMARDTITLARTYGVKPEDIVIEQFGEGADTGRQIAMATDGNWDVFMVNTGNKPEDLHSYDNRFELKRNEIDSASEKCLYLNIRALMYFRARRWLKEGGQLVKHVDLPDQLLSIKYTTQLRSDLIKLMSKERMQKEGLRSPNAADAFALSNLIDLDAKEQSTEEAERIRRLERAVDDPYAVL